MADQDLSELLANMDPQELEQILGLGTIPEKRQAIERRMAYANALRDSPAVANAGGGGPTMFQGLGGLATKLLGAYQSHKLGQEEDALTEQAKKGRQAFLSSLAAPRDYSDVLALLKRSDQAQAEPAPFDFGPGLGTRNPSGML